MPKGNTHDTVTLVLMAPVFAAAYIMTDRLAATLIVTAAFLFGGMMFGPDLDTGSKQYSRWWIFRPIWLPYRALFRHRSRFSHGLVFGALIRVLYFHAMAALVIFFGLYVWTAMFGGEVPGWKQLFVQWNQITETLRTKLGDTALMMAFAGTWLGAASHTLTDLAGTFIWTGRKRL